jgi:hypothetical protein
MIMEKMSSPRDRKRSRSPDRHQSSKRRRSRSPRRHHSHREKTTGTVRLPYKQSALHKGDFEAYRHLFADYLDLQKQIDVSTLGEDEVKGRWKSFLGKWNRGELAEGWYDPSSKQRADARAAEDTAQPTWTDQSVARKSISTKASNEQPKDDEDDDGFGPALPSSRTSHGPHIPRTQDLQNRQELAEEDRSAQRADRKYERKQDQLAQKERLEELVPRAAPGSRDRQLEKKREVAASNRSFADAKDAGAAEVLESDLMGASGVDEYKAELQANQRRKNEREIRKEEVLRARAEEREEKLAEHRRKEDKTMDMLKALAAQRYGSGGLS